MSDKIVSKPVESLQNSTYCFYEKGKPHVFDSATLREDGSYLSHCGDKSEDEIRAAIPNIVFMTWDDAMIEIEKLNTESYSEVKEITAERYEEMLDVLPPMDWANDSFLICEATTGGWHACFLKYNGKYYEGHSNRRNENSIQRRMRFIKEIEKK